jgi:hypothetical protein
MGRWKRCCIVSLLGAFSAARALADDSLAEAPFGLADAIAHGRLTLELRPRYNRIDETDKPDRTEGVTTRAIIGWRTAPWNGLRATLEAIDADHIGSKRFNDDGAQFASSPYPLLPDPRYAGLNRAWIEYDAPGATRLRVGRQRVRLGNQRWVSDNDFRQVPQLFDGVEVVNTALSGTELSAGRYWRVRTTSGDLDSLRLTLVRAAWNPAPGQSLSAYGVFHDQAQNGASTGFADNSYRVSGVRAEGSVARFGGVEIPYEAEYAWQKPYAGGDSRIDARYWRAGLGAAARDWTVRYDQEVKGSNGGVYGAQMPLTDFYALNGWTLHFFNTPARGLVDRWVTLRWSRAGWTLYGESHRFRSDFGGLDYGREQDLGLTYAFEDDIVARLQYARYDSGAGAPEARVRKTWLTFTYAY